MAAVSEAVAGSDSTSTAPTTSTIPIKVHFYGGLDLVFDGAHSLNISLPTTSVPPTAGSLIGHMADTHLADSPKKHFFVKDGTVTPGILVLINEADWELEGKEDTDLKAGDDVVFVSTLHGG